MAILDADFSALLWSYNLEDLDDHAGAIYGLSDDWRLRYFNEGWGRFARDNGGEPAISTRFPLGASVLDVLTCGELRRFYVASFARCLTDGHVWTHEYECSSAEIYRRFQMTVYPLRRRGLLIVNSNTVERPHDGSERPPRDADETVYRDDAGLIHQCAHCRRTQRARQPAVWDWVPDWVTRMPAAMSHTFCPPCLGFHYPDASPRQ